MRRIDLDQEAVPLVASNSRHRSPNHHLRTQMSSQDLKLLVEGAVKGDSLAQLALGVRYARGDGVPQDYHEAVRLWTMSAKSGNADAMCNLGNMADPGMTPHVPRIEEDHQLAAMWYLKAANKGHAKAQYNLSIKYRKGDGVQMSMTDAYYWCKKSADQGDTNAIHNLGVMTNLGQGVEKDTASGEQLKKEAARRGTPRDKFFYACTLIEKKGLNADFAGALALWHEAAAEGYSPALRSIGCCYLNGEGVPKDEIEAYAYFNLAAVDDLELAPINRRDLEAKMTREEIVAGQRRTRELAAELKNKRK